MSSAKGLTHYGPRSVETFTGIELSLDDPQPWMFTIRDIAVGLGNVCRFSGQVRRFYSVAEHSVLVSDLLGVMGRADLRFPGLMHDGSEAYIADVIAPVKLILRDNPEHTLEFGGRQSNYDLLSKRLDAAIEKAFDYRVSEEDHKVIKQADYWALRIETYSLCHSKGHHWTWPGTYSTAAPEGVNWRGGLLPFEASMLFETRFEELSS